MRKWTPYLLLIPTFIIIVLFIYIPAEYSIKASMQRILPFGRGTSYIGLTNFLKLFSNADYLYSVRFTILYVTVTVGIAIIFSFLIALLLVKKIPGVKLFRTLIFVPYAISPAIAGALWTFLLNPIVGHVSYFFQALEAADELKKENISIEIIDMYSIKPFDKKNLLNSISKTEALLVVEDHQKRNGLGYELSNFCLKNRPVPFDNLGLNDTFAESGNYYKIIDKYGISKKTYFL